MIQYRFEYIQYKTTGLRSLFTKTVIKETTLTLKTGKMSAIMGKTGSGKTSVLYRLGLIENNQWDRYNLNGTQIDLNNEDEKANYRASKIAYVYQDNNMFDDLTLKENLEIISDISSLILDAPKYLNLVGLEEDLLNHKVSTLSGGEKQRAALAISLMKEPELLLLDEPTSKLDNENKYHIIDLLKTIQKQTGVTIVMVTHDKELAEICDEIFVVEDQTIKCIRSCEDEGEIKTRKLVQSKMPNQYLKKVFKAHFKSYTTILISLAMLLSLAQSIAYAGNQFLSDQADAIASVPDTTILVVNNGANMAHVQDFVGNENLSKEEIEKILDHPYINMAIPLFYQKAYIVKCEGDPKEQIPLYMKKQKPITDDLLVPFYKIYIPREYLLEHSAINVDTLNNRDFSNHDESQSYKALSPHFKEFIDENSYYARIEGALSCKILIHKNEKEANAYSFYQASNEYGYNTGNEWYDANMFNAHLLPGRTATILDDFDDAMIINVLEDRGYQNFFSDMEYVVYESIESVEQISSFGLPIKDNKMYGATSSYLITVDDYHHLEEVVNYLKEISDDIGVQYDQSAISYYQEILLHLDTFMTIFFGLLIPLILFALILLIYRYFISRIYDIGILKTYGLSHRMTYAIYYKLFTYAFIIIYLLSALLMGIEAVLLSFVGIVDYPLLGFILLITLIIMVVGYLYAMLYVEYLVGKTKAATLLKNN